LIQPSQEILMQLLTLFNDLWKPIYSSKGPGSIRGAKNLLVCLFIICSVLFMLGDVLRSNLLLELWTEFNIVPRESTQCIWRSARDNGIFGNLPWPPAI
jgi:hypothetical protein